MSLRHAVRSLLALHVAATTGPCTQQLLDTGTSSNLAANIDPDSPATACSMAVCTSTELGGCASAGKENLILVMSDEFNKDGRGLAVYQNDPLWTAENLYYQPTSDMEVYTAQQVATGGGALEITINKGVGQGISQAPDGSSTSVAMPFVSGMVSSWNKFCFTGGYLEVSAVMPGDDFYSGFWPATWMMGNLGRAGYMASTGGMWPYSYDVCDAAAGKVDWSSLPGQRFSACPDTAGNNRTRYGWPAGVGRGAPEVDLFEMSVPSSLNGLKGTPTAHDSDYSLPYVSQTLQMAPLQPPGTAFMASGVNYPGASSDFDTQKSSWSGIYGRPGNTYQDSFSAVSSIDTSFFSEYHNFGLFWQPGEVLRWYIDGQITFELTAAALAAVSNSSGAEVGQRQIPLEAMYIIMNLGMSNDFTPVDLYRLSFPATMKVDYIRLYQDPTAINVGCSPAAYPTQQYLACNKDLYIVLKEDRGRIPGGCTSGALATQPALSIGLLAVLLLCLA